jgi:Ca2+-binding RTX toxin-like protein
MRRLVLAAMTGALALALAATAAFAQQGEPDGGEERRCFLPEGCFLSGDGSDEIVVGGGGPDHLLGGGGDDAVYGMGGEDRIDADAGNDLVYGGDGDDFVDGGSGDDVVIGGDGADAVSGFEGSDAISGGGGGDFLFSANDGTPDRVSGGPGFDVCVVGVEDLPSTFGCERVFLL